MPTPDINLRRDMQTHKPQFPFWGFSIAIVSIAYGLFVLLIPNYLNSIISPLISAVQEEWVAGFSILSGITKIVGVLKQNNSIKRVGIVMLSATWAVILAISILYCFGIGYPYARFLFVAYILLSCLRVSLKGDFVS